MRRSFCWMLYRVNTGSLMARRASETRIYSDGRSGAWLRFVCKSPLKQRICSAAGRKRTGESVITYENGTFNQIRHRLAPKFGEPASTSPRVVAAGGDRLG